MPMNSQETDNIVKAMHGICDAIGAMAKVRDALDARYATTMTKEDRILLLAATKVCTHLVEAGADVPNEFWGIMLRAGIGADELKTRLDAVMKAA